MKTSVLAVAVCLTLSVAMSAQTLRYSLRDLGTFGGTSAEAMGVNNSGQAVGRYATPGRMNCFFWSTATLGTSTWSSKSSTGSCAAYGINENGQMSGTITLADGTTSNAFRATRDPKRGTVNITYLAGPYGAGTYGSGLNVNGDVIGTSNGQFGHIAALFKGDGTYTEIGATSCSDSYGSAIGANTPYFMCPAVSSTDGSLLQNAFSRLNGANVALQLLAIPPFQREQVNAVDISGVHPVGYDYTQDGIMHATQWQFDPPTGFFHAIKLTILKSWATGVSDDNWIIGQMTDNSHPFVQFPNPNCWYPVDLNSLLDSSGAGWTVLTANGINRTHQIAGSASFNGVTHAVLLTSNGGSYCP